MSRLQKLNADLNGLHLQAEYWDVRVEESFETAVSIVKGEVTTCTSSPSLGAFVRVRKDGFWFYEATTEVDRLREVLMRLDQETPRTPGGDTRGTASPTTASATAPTLGSASFKVEKQSPFIAIKASDFRFDRVPLEKKLELACRYEAVLREAAQVVSTQLRYQDIYKIKSFINSVGTQFEFDFNQAGFRAGFTLKENDLLFEDIYRLYGSRFSELEGHQESIGAFVESCRPFLKAPSVEPGKYRVLLDAETAGVFTHESFGHKSEADFMLGNQEALEEWKIGKKIASDCLTIVDYGGHENSSGYCPIDDDGTPARKNYLIRNGVLAGRLHTRETASQLGEEPTGNSRAMSFEWEPMVRMTSTYIEQGTESLESLLKRCEGALLVEGVKHGSGLSTFTIAPTRGYRIGKDGVREPVRLTVISGSVFETLQNVEAVSSEFHLHSSAIGGCGKMSQWPLPVSDGGPYVLIKEMQVS